MIRSLPEAVSSQTADTLIPFAGLGLYNPGSKRAKVIIEVYSYMGIPAGKGNVELGPGMRM